MEDKEKRKYIVAMLYQLADDLTRQCNYNSISVEQIVDYFRTNYTRVHNPQIEETHKVKSMRTFLRTEYKEIPFRINSEGKYFVSYPWKDGRI